MRGIIAASGFTLRSIAEGISPVYATVRCCLLIYLCDVISYHMAPEDRIVEKARRHVEKPAEMAEK